MKRIKTYILLVTVCVITVGLTPSYAQSSGKLLREGDAAYKKEDYSSAELSYRKARQEESNLASNFNLGNSTYQQERYEEAAEHFMNATRNSSGDIEKSDTYYNLGNAFFNAQKIDEAIEAYKQAIRLNPDNQEAKYNLTYLKLMQKAQDQQQQQQQENQEKDQDQQENQEEQDQENQNQENQEEQNQQQQDGDSGEQEQQEEQESEQDSTSQQDAGEANFDSTRLEKQTLDSLDAAKLLQIIQSEEQKVQEKLRKFNSNRKKPDKDW